MEKKIALELIAKEKEFAIANGRDPKSWYLYHNHIYGVAEIAKAIAMKTSDIDPNKAYFMGFLHDIGKLREDVYKRHHGILGYEMLKDIDKDVARVCITHMFGTTLPRLDKDFFDNKEDFDFVKGCLEANGFNEYDKLIQCCDMFADARGFVTIEQRAEDYEKRHNKKLPEGALEPRKELKKYFDKKIGCDIYSLFSELNAKNFFIINSRGR